MHHRTRPSIIVPSYRIDANYYCDNEYDASMRNSDLSQSMDDFGDEDFLDEVDAANDAMHKENAFSVSIPLWAQDSLSSGNNSVSTPHSQGHDESDSISYKSPEKAMRKRTLQGCALQAPRKRRKVFCATEESTTDAYTPNEIARMHQREEEKERLFLLMPASEVPVLVEEMPVFDSYKKAFVFFLKKRLSSRCGLSVTHLVSLVNCKQCVVNPEDDHKPQPKISVNRATAIIEKDIQRRAAKNRDPVFIFEDEQKRFVRYFAGRSSRKKQKKSGTSDSKRRLQKGTPKRLHDSYIPDEVEFRNYHKMQERFLEWQQQKAEEDVIFDDEE